MIYVLSLENDKWYIGYTKRVNYDRISEHFSNNGSKWTKVHKPIQLVLFKEGELEDEKKMTLEYMKQYGWSNVRGGPWCRVEMKKPPSILVLGDDYEIKDKSGNKWTDHEINMLHIELKDKKDFNQIAALHSRSTGAIVAKAKAIYCNNSSCVTRGLRSYCKWTDDEINKMHKEFKNNKNFNEIAILHSRSTGAIISKFAQILEKIEIVND